MKPFNTAAFVLSDWIAYYAERAQIMLNDPTQTPTEKLKWMGEFVSDLADLDTLPPETPHIIEAQQLAHAQHAFIFHGGPDPNEYLQTS